jgi:hypothetical protein
MKPGTRTFILFMFPILAVFICAAVAFSLPPVRPYAPERPQFLDYIERLGVTSLGVTDSGASDKIRNVFTHVDEKAKDPGTVQADPPAAAKQAPPVKEAAYRPVWVSMIVDDGANSFSVINGQKMRIGERAENFTLTAIRKGSVTLRHTDGIEETIHVKAF